MVQGGFCPDPVRGTCRIFIEGGRQNYSCNIGGLPYGRGTSQGMDIGPHALETSAHRTAPNCSAACGQLA